MSNGINSTEEFVFNVCRRTSLSLWCYANPLAETGKELCDILIVCDPHVIIISVKDIQLNTEKQEDGYRRWVRKAVNESVKQLYGAERVLATAPNIIRKDGMPGLALPAPVSRKTHRVAVAFGSRGEAPIASKEFGKGFVHVMNGEGFSEILNELDTITDFVDYLTAKEDLIAHSTVIVEGHESNLLGWYLCHGRKFPQRPDMLVIDHTIWQNIRENSLFQDRKHADLESYTWDSMIEFLSDSSAKSLDGPCQSLNETDVALREMARETRFSRRMLGRHLKDFLDKGKTKGIRARAMAGERGVIYIFVHFRANEESKYRLAELGARCCAARLKVGHGHTVIGVGIGEKQPDKGVTSDVIYMQLDDWSTMENDAILKGFRFFSESEMRKIHENEYPELPPST